MYTEGDTFLVVHMLKAKVIYYLISTGLIIFSLEGNSLVHYLCLLGGLILLVVVLFRK